MALISLKHRTVDSATAGVFSLKGLLLVNGVRFKPDPVLERLARSVSRCAAASTAYRRATHPALPEYASATQLKPRHSRGHA